MHSQPHHVFAPWPAAPGNNATIQMFSTHPRNGAPRSLDFMDRRIASITITWLINDQASAANGLRVYALRKDGVTFTEVDLRDDFNNPTIGTNKPVQVPVVAAGAEFRATLVTAHLVGFAIDYTAGGAGPTAWDGCMAVSLGGLVIQR